MARGKGRRGGALSLTKGGGATGPGGPPVCQVPPRGRIVVATFHRMGWSIPLAQVDGKVGCPWDGWPRPALGEQWDCRVQAEWDTGMLLVPLRRLHVVDDDVA